MNSIAHPKPAILLAALVIAVSAPLHPNRTSADPMYFATTALAAADVMSVTNRGPDLNLTITLENYRLVSDLHERLTPIEESIGQIMTMLVDQSAKNRKIFASELDIAEAQLIVNAHLLLARALRDDGLIDKDEKERLNQHKGAIERTVMKLRGRTPVTVALPLSIASAVELAFEEALGGTAKDLEVVRDFYLKELGALLDEASPDSLPSTISELKVIRDERFRNMVDEYPGETDPFRGTGSYWGRLRSSFYGQLLHSYVLKERVRGPSYASDRCKPGTGDSELNLCVPMMVPSWKWQDAEADARCFYVEVTHQTLPHGDFAFSVGEPTMSRCPKKHATQRATNEFEKEKEKDLKAWKEERLAPYNAAAWALADVGRVQDAVKFAISQVDSYDPASVARLLAAHAEGVHAANRILAVRDSGTAAEVSELIRSMRRKREKAQATVAQADAAIQSAIGELQSRQSQEQAVTALRFLAGSIKAYQRLDRKMARLNSGGPEVTSPAEPGEGLPSRRSPALAGKRMGPVREVHPVEDRSVHERMWYVHGAIERLESSRGEPITETLTDDELAGYKALAILHEMGDSGADLLVRKFQLDKVDAARDVTVDVLLGKDPISTFFKTALTPEVLSGGTIIDLEARQAATRQLDSLLLDRHKKRFPREFAPLPDLQPRSEAPALKPLP